MKSILEKLHITELNDMQQAVGRAVRDTQNDIVVLSPTGSGKTLAYLLPLIESLTEMAGRSKESPVTAEAAPLAIVITPGRELAQQSAEVLKSTRCALRGKALYGGRPTMEEHRELRKEQPHIIFCTPGRVNDHITKQNLRVENVEWLVIDEFDKCLEMGFQQEMMQLIACLPVLKRRILLSATEVEAIPRFVKMGRTERLDYRQASSRVKIYKVMSREKDKLPTLKKLLLDLEQQQTVVFLNYRDSVERTVDYLRSEGFTVSLFHGGLEQHEREAAIYRFANGSANILVATDLASRGLDIPDIDNIVHYHIPETRENYTHRIGRTARWDKSGRAFFILNTEEHIPDYVTEKAEEYTSSVTDSKLPPKPRMTTLYIGRGKKDKLSKGDIVGFLCKKGGLKATDIGMISVLERYCYVAIQYQLVNRVLEKVRGEKIKGMKTIIEETSNTYQGEGDYFIIDGFIRVAAAVPSVKVADVQYNLEQIKTQIDEAVKKRVQLIVFPELCITGYTCQDLFYQRTLLQEAEFAVQELMGYTEGKNIVVIVGVPVHTGKMLLNCAAVINNGYCDGMVAKTYLPNYGEFYEKRWFGSVQDYTGKDHIFYANSPVRLHKEPLLFELFGGVRFGVEICEDLWAPVPPSNHLALAGADIIFNLSASDELIGKHDYLKSLIAQQSARTISAYVYSSCGFGESTQDVVYGGNAMIYENGTLLAEGKRFSFSSQMVITEIDIERLRTERIRNTTFVNAQGRESEADHIILDTASVMAPDAGHLLKYRTIDPHPFIPSKENMEKSCEEIFNIQVAGLAKRIVHTNSKTVIIGISGGLDSTLALLVCVKTFDKLGLSRKGIVGVTMPGFGTTDRTYHNAISLMQSLGVSIREISIAKAVMQHFEDIGHDPSVHDVAYENSQARERTQILMDLTNEIGGMVIGTGDLSELALGWATYNGDHMSMYGVNASIPKTLIRYLVSYVAESEVDKNSRATLLDIIDTPISPELIPADEQGNIKQKTEDLVGPYELHDFFLYYVLRYGYRPTKIFQLAKEAFQYNPKTSHTPKYSDATIKKWLTTFYRRFFSQQFKRSCLPDGPKVGSVSLSPRGDWRMPSDASCASWLHEIESM